MQGNFHLSLLQEPLRQCLVTQKLWPKSFLVRLNVKKRREDDSAVVVPRILLNSKQSSAKSIYVLCRPDAVNWLGTKGSYKRFYPKATFPPFTEERIGTELALRVVDEVKYLYKLLQERPDGIVSPFFIINPETTETVTEAAAILDFRKEKIAIPTHFEGSAIKQVVDITPFDRLRLPPSRTQTQIEAIDADGLDLTKSSESIESRVADIDKINPNPSPQLQPNTDLPLSEQIQNGILLLLSCPGQPKSGESRTSDVKLADAGLIGVRSSDESIRLLKILFRYQLWYGSTWSSV